MRKSSILIGILLSISSGELQAVVSDTTETEAIGYLDLRADSLGVPLYVDNVLVGTAPLSEPIPVLPGIHEVSYLPPELNTPQLKTALREAIKRVYIPPNDTIRVTLYYQSQVDRIRAIQLENTVSTYIGFIMIGIVLVLLWQIT